MTPASQAKPINIQTATANRYTLLTSADMSLLTPTIIVSKWLVKPDFIQVVNEVSFAHCPTIVSFPLFVSINNIMELVVCDYIFE